MYSNFMTESQAENNITATRNIATGETKIYHVPAALTWETEVTKDMLQKAVNLRNEINFWINRDVLERYSNLIPGVSNDNVPLMYGCTRCAWSCMQYEMGLKLNLLSRYANYNDVAYKKIAAAGAHGYADEKLNPKEGFKTLKERTEDPCLCIESKLHYTNALKRTMHKFKDRYLRSVEKSIKRGHLKQMHGEHILPTVEAMDLSSVRCCGSLCAPIGYMSCCPCVNYTDDVINILKNLFDPHLLNIICGYLFCLTKMETDTTGFYNPRTREKTVIMPYKKRRHEAYEEEDKDKEMHQCTKRVRMAVVNAPSDRRAGAINVDNTMWRLQTQHILGARERHVVNDA